MKSSRPPAVATWLLHHLAPGQNSDALAGDLIEEYQRGRSESWYWRQVLIAWRTQAWFGLSGKFYTWKIYPSRLRIVRFDLITSITYSL